MYSRTKEYIRNKTIDIIRNKNNKIQKKMNIKSHQICLNYHYLLHQNNYFVLKKKFHMNKGFQLTLKKWSLTIFVMILVPCLFPDLIFMNAYS